MNDYYFEVGDPTQDTPEGDSGWGKDLMEHGVICNSCKSVVISRSIDVKLSHKLSTKTAPVTFEYITSILILSNEIICSLGESMIERVFHFGRLIDHKGKIVDTFRTCVPKIEVAFIRGGPESTCRRCGNCGKVHYFPLPLIGHYLVENQLASGNVFASNRSGGLIISSDLLEKVNNSAIGKLEITKLPVLKYSIDGKDSCFEH